MAIERVPHCTGDTKCPACTVFTAIESIYWLVPGENDGAYIAGAVDALASVIVAAMKPESVAGVRDKIVAQLDGSIAYFVKQDAAMNKEGASVQ